MYYLRQLNFVYGRYRNDYEQLKQHNTSNHIPFTSTLGMFFIFIIIIKKET